MELLQGRSISRRFIPVHFEQHVWTIPRNTNPVERWQEGVRKRTTPRRSLADDRSSEGVVYAMVAGVEPDVPRRIHTRLGLFQRLPS